MSSSARKKEKHRLKRKEKKHQIQRMNSRTALQRIAAEGGELECWSTPDWKEQGLASIQVLGRAPGGRGVRGVPGGSMGGRPEGRLRSKRSSRH